MCQFSKRVSHRVRPDKPTFGVFGGVGVCDVEEDGLLLNPAVLLGQAAVLLLLALAEAGQHGEVPRLSARRRQAAHRPSQSVTVGRHSPSRRPSRRGAVGALATRGARGLK